MHHSSGWVSLDPDTVIDPDMRKKPSDAAGSGVPQHHGALPVLSLGPTAMLQTFP